MAGLTFVKILADVTFASFMLKLPTSASWRQPMGMPATEHYAKSISPADMIAIPSTIPPLFTPQNFHKYHQNSCDTIGKGFSDFMIAMIDGVDFAHKMWKLQAKFQNLQVMAVSAIGTPGCLTGPDLESNIKNAPSTATMMGKMAKWRDAVAAGVSKCFKDWQDNVTVPGLPWYPAFAAFPGPMAPPMPNVPMPLIACMSPMMARITVPNTLAQEMESNLDGGIKSDDKDKQYKACFMGISTVLAMSFLMWLPMQQVMLVMGKGQIPTFAPPFVPVGPVMGGDNIAAPGHMLT